MRDSNSNDKRQQANGGRQWRRQAIGGSKRQVMAFADSSLTKRRRAHPGPAACRSSCRSSCSGKFHPPGRSQGNQSSHNQNGDLEHGRVRMERCSSCPGSCLSTVGVMASISSVRRLMGTLRLGLQSQVVTPLPKILLSVVARIGRQHGWLYRDSVSKRWPASIVLPCAGPAMETGARNVDSTGGHEDRALVLQDRTPAMVTVVQTCVCGWHGLAPSRGTAVIG